MNSALLVIDYQNAIFAAPPAYQAELVLERIRQLIEKARQNGVAVVYVQHDEPGSEWEAGKQSWKFPDVIAPTAGDYVSAKQSCDAFRQTKLEQHLRERGIKKVFICGFATDFCVDTNVRRCASLELETIVVADAHTTRNRPHLSAQKVIEHHNWVWQHFSNPGNAISLCTADAVQFSER